MNRNTNREEAFRLAAEKVRKQKEREALEEKEFYKKITSGWTWMIFKSVVVFCSLMAVISTIEVLVDGPSKKISENEWKIDRNWEYTWHKVLDVEGYMFTPELSDWFDRVENTMEITYTPIFRTGKTLSYDIQVDENSIRRHEEIRRRTSLTWFPAFQIFLLVPFFTFIFKRQKPWFNFARVVSLVIVFPGTLMVLFYTML